MIKSQLFQRYNNRKFFWVYGFLNSSIYQQHLPSVVPVTTKTSSGSDLKFLHKLQIFEDACNGSTITNDSTVEISSQSFGEWGTGRSAGRQSNGPRAPFV